MTFVAMAWAWMLEASKHPVVRQALNHAIRLATREAVRHIQKRTRMTKGVTHIQ